MHVIHERFARIRREDKGFTLVELVLTVAIMGFVAAALCGIVLQYLKTTTDTSARLTESTDQQFISTYWQNDVSSLGRQTVALGTGAVSTEQSVFVGSAGPTGCGSSVGSVAVAFAWKDFKINASDPDQAWDAIAHEVAYVTVPTGTRLTLKRVRCRGGVAAEPYTVAHNLTSAPTIDCDTACGAASLPNRVSMTFTVKDASALGSTGYTTKVSADRRQG